MFVNAIEKAAKYTRPIHTISKSYKSNDVTPGAATLFFINDEGYAVTCRHVIELLVQSENISKNYSEFKAERDKLPKTGRFKQQLERLKIKYNISDTSTVQLRNSFIGCVDKMSGFTWHIHPKYDLAILKFNDFTNLLCSEFPVFKKNSSDIQQGKFLCRLGFPFSEFNNFHYNDKIDEIEWSAIGNSNSPRFPIEGMVTRFLADEKGDKYGIELSSPGLRGQSGGPLFDKDGLVCGMQSQTISLHLGFDIENKEVIVKGQKKKINDYSFINLGVCIHMDVIKDFLKQYDVKFSEQ